MFVLFVFHPSSNLVEHANLSFHLYKDTAIACEEIRASWQTSIQEMLQEYLKETKTTKL